ncbi:purine-nucleoside phosphorylase [Lentiprolixibacter aurantiacus]|uniref:Uridine phosphorylase n=1 Tax=Lentiprolixibacter aurantiacus TaxID=2993939 RepID=A0AAE3MKY3_9FLAO|nr:purine-nucleoside phosphorylase [Lentiprolixibacter aurantiacus]MCX2718942.1 purine-nucleoside phosphorylase [Lentiprolixibacter aurantiacus]
MSLHIEAKAGEIAETVLLPGDPLRAKWIAETFLENARCYNQVRGMLGFTGTYKGKSVSVQGSGMGIPSAMIYYSELIRDYGVKTLIRVGTAGSYQKDIQLRDVVIAMSSSTTSAINQYRLPGSYAPTANSQLFLSAVRYARENGIAFKAGNVLSADEFYDFDPDSYEIWARFGVLCVEMETAGLYTLAAQHGVKALAIMSIADHLLTRERISIEAREQGFGEMVSIALNCTNAE